jgi:4-hydroxy-tetrahydrodipicolinate synthase
MWQGSLVALVTPMYEDGGLDYQALDRLLEFHLAQGTDGLVILGSTGEGSALTLDERLQFTQHVVETIDGRLPVIVGVGSNSTRMSIEAAQQMAELGVDGLLMICPYYNKPTQEGIYQHFKVINDAVNCPIILYNHPGRTGSDMLPETVARLAACKNVIGLKEAVVDAKRFAALSQLVSADFALYSGDDASCVELFKAGAKGVISVVANIIPENMQAIAMAASKQDWDLANNLLQANLALIDAMSLETNPIPVKWALAAMQFMEAGIRLPLTMLTESHQQQLLKIMQAQGLLQKEKTYVKTA